MTNNPQSSTSEPELVEAVANEIQESLAGQDVCEETCKTAAQNVIAIAREAIEGPLKEQIARLNDARILNNNRMAECREQLTTLQAENKALLQERAAWLGQFKLEATEGERTKLEEWQACYAALFNQLEPLKAEVARIREDIQGMKADEAELRRVAWENPQDLRDFVRLNYPRTTSQASERGGE